jgi:hypothetical protein
LDSGPAALHRLPESVAHFAEALWMQALDEGRRRAHQKLKASERVATDHQQNWEVRSHVLTLREGELDSRLRARDRSIEALQLQVNALTGLLRKEQATRELLTQQLAAKTSPVKRRPRTTALFTRTIRKRPERKTQKKKTGARSKASRRRQG